jgi:hypothetical protein
LNSATLQASDMSGALMQDAVLDYANIEGASLEQAGLKNASFRCVKIYRARFNKSELNTAAIQPCPAAFETSWVDSITYDRSPYTRNDDAAPDLGFTTYEPDMVGCSPDFTDRKITTSEEFKSFVDRCLENFSSPDKRQYVEFKFGALSPSAKTTEEDAKDRSSWSALEKAADHSTELSRLQMDRLREIACVKEGAPFVARGILRNRLPALASDDRKALLSALRAAAQEHANGCPGVQELLLNEFDEEKGPPLK